MNKVIAILVEGQTELEFVKNLIFPYLSDHGIHTVRPISIETSPGFICLPSNKVVMFVTHDTNRIFRQFFVAKKI